MFNEPTYISIKETESFLRKYHVFSSHRSELVNPQIACIPAVSVGHLERDDFPFV